MRSNAKLPKTLGRKIQNIRKKKTDMTQEDLADKVGISRAYMGYIEQGRNIPSVEVLAKIARVLKVPVSNLFS